MELTISLAQMNVVLGQPQANFEQAADWIVEAARRGSTLVLFPELWTTGYDLQRAHELAQVNRALLLPGLQGLADTNNIAVGGSMLLEEDGQVYNTFVLHQPGQNEPVRYQKTHLFRLMEEERWLSPGGWMQTAEGPWGKASLAICYDLRFPELFRRYALDGATMTMLCAEWPARRRDHWQTLLRARAIENQSWMVATNCVGLTGAETFGGRSAIISPWGETVAEASDSQPELLSATIALEQVEQVRKTIPVWQDRRPDLYGS